MDSEPPRMVFAWAGLAGAAVAGTYTAVMALFHGQPLSVREQVGVVVNLIAAVLVGGAASYFLGPAIASKLTAALGEPHALGFAIGFGAWEVIPWARDAVDTIGKRLGKAGKP